MNTHVPNSNSIAIAAIVLLLVMNCSPQVAAEDYIFRDLYTLGLAPGFYLDNKIKGIAAGGEVTGYGYTQPSTSSDNRAIVWNLSNPNGVPLISPNEFGTTWGIGTDGMQQVGFYQSTNFGPFAFLWNGIGSNPISLNPVVIVGMTSIPWTSSSAKAVSAGKQVGWGIPPNDSERHAVLWSGSSQDFVDLHPQGWISSEATGVGGDEQVGYGRLPQGERAVVWHSSSASAIDLTPAGYRSAVAIGTDGDQQVGYTYDANNGFPHAALWSGTAASYVELSGIAIDGNAYVARNGRQVGIVGGNIVVWSGSAQSAVNLSALMPPNLGAFMLDGRAYPGPLAIGPDGTIYAIVREGGTDNYHVVSFTPTDEIANTLRVVDMRRLTNGYIHLDCVGLPNLPFSIYASDAPAPPFQRVYSTTADDDGKFQYEDNNGGAKRFYQLRYP